VLRHARQVLASMSDMATELAALQGAQVGDVTVGIGPLYLESAFVRAVERFKPSHPGVRVNLMVDYWYSLHDALMRDEIHFYLADVKHAEDEENVSISTFIDQPIVVLAHPDHPLTKRARCRGVDLLAYPLLAPKLPDRIQQWFAAQATNDRLRRQLERNVPSIEYSHFTALRGLLILGDYYTAAPQTLFQDEIERGDLRAVLVEDFDFRSAMGLVHRTDRTLPTAAHALMACFRDLHCTRR
jgi:DNA-binding transcriptional LysR family regulator